MAKSKALAKKEKVEVEILTAEEIQKIDKAVDYINAQANSTAKSLIEIGQYLLKEFFEGDIKKAEDRGSRKGISLRKIAEHPEITLSYRTLANAMHLSHQEYLFSDAKYKALSETHKMLLFSVSDNKKKLSFADKVVSEKLSVNKLREKLIDAKYILPRGRGALSDHSEIDDPFESFIKPIERLVKLDVAVDKLDVKFLTEDHIQALNNLKKSIETLLAKVDKPKT